jgi:nucleoid DNA-binding protein
MDIAKYIGLFLLKNQFCYIHGLGNLVLKKKPATYDGTTLQSGAYEVYLTPGGSIDDSLANFIATNEQISISKAANALRDYSLQSRAELQQGKEVPIPNIGKFVEVTGKIQFFTDEKFSFTPPGIPVIRNSKRLEEELKATPQIPVYPPTKKTSSVNWSRVVIAIVLLIIIAGAIYGVYYMKTHNSANNNATVQKTNPTDTMIRATVVDSNGMRTPVPAQQPGHDSVPVSVDPAAPPPPPSPDVHPAPQAATNTQPANPAPAPQTSGNEPAVEHQVVVGMYTTRDKAEKRFTQLRKNGNNVSIVRKDSTDYLIVNTFSFPQSKTQHVLDSMRALFGYKGTAVYK